MKTLAAILLLAVTNTALADELTVKATTTADYKVCGDVFVTEGREVLGSSLKQLARTQAWEMYKDPVKLRQKYAFDYVYSETTSKLLAMTSHDLTKYCNDKYNK